MVTNNNQVNLVQVCSLNIEQSRLLQFTKNIPVFLIFRQNISFICLSQNISIIGRKFHVSDIPAKHFHHWQNSSIIAQKNDNLLKTFPCFWYSGKTFPSLAFCNGCPSGASANKWRLTAAPRMKNLWNPFWQQKKRKRKKNCSDSKKRERKNVLTAKKRERKWNKRERERKIVLTAKKEKEK